MKIENSAKNVNPMTEEVIGIEKLDSGDYKITASQELFSINDEGGLDKESKVIEMIFTQNGLNALIGSFMAISK